jgi:hypothetical protein
VGRIMLTSASAVLLARTDSDTVSIWLNDKYGDGTYISLDKGQWRSFRDYINIWSENPE